MRTARLLRALRRCHVPSGSPVCDSPRKHVPESKWLPLRSDETVVLDQQKADVASSQVAKQPCFIEIKIDCGIQIDSVPDASSGGGR